MSTDPSRPAPKKKRHPRKPVLRHWVTLASLMAALLVMMVPYGILPLYQGAVSGPEFRYELVLPLAIGAALCLSLPFAIWWVNARHAATILRVSTRKLVVALVVLMGIPTSIMENGVPLTPAPLYLFVAGTSGYLDKIAIAAAFCMMGAIALYPLTSAILWGLRPLWRVPALLALPIGSYLFVRLAGGNI